MAERWTKPELSKEEQREVDEKKKHQRAQQPYASELSDRELEHAQQEKRPTRTNDGNASDGPAGNP